MLNSVLAETLRHLQTKIHRPVDVYFLKYTICIRQYTIINKKTKSVFDIEEYCIVSILRTEQGEGNPR